MYVRWTLNKIIYEQKRFCFWASIFFYIWEFIGVKNILTEVVGDSTSKFWKSIGCSDCTILVCYCIIADRWQYYTSTIAVHDEISDMFQKRAHNRASSALVTDKESSLRLSNREKHLQAQESFAVARPSTTHAFHRVSTYIHTWNRSVLGGQGEVHLKSIKHVHVSIAIIVGLRHAFKANYTKLKLHSHVRPICW